MKDPTKQTSRLKEFGDWFGENIGMVLLIFMALIIITLAIWVGVLYNNVHQQGKRNDLASAHAKSEQDKVKPGQQTSEVSTGQTNENGSVTNKLTLDSSPITSTNPASHIATSPKSPTNSPSSSTNSRDQASPQNSMTVNGGVSGEHNIVAVGPVTLNYGDQRIPPRSAKAWTGDWKPTRSVNATNFPLQTLTNVMVSKDEVLEIRIEQGLALRPDKADSEHFDVSYGDNTLRIEDPDPNTRTYYPETIDGYWRIVIRVKPGLPDNEYRYRFIMVRRRS